MIFTLANSTWLAGCLAEYARFRRSARRVEEAQQARLRRLLAANAGTEFGKLHRFAAIRSAAEYQQRVPLRDYGDHQEWIDRTAQGAPNQLTREPVRMFEPTSGSSSSGSSATKLIPYTASLQREFQRGIRAWIANLFLQDPQLLSGPAYWSISPAGDTPDRTLGGIPIGYDDDAAYAGGVQRRLVRAVMAVPAAVRSIPDMETFRYLTLLFLLRSRDLKLISVWNPTFLSLLVARLPEWGDELARDLERGTISRPAPAALMPVLVNPHHGPVDSGPLWQRANEVRAALRYATPAERHQCLWPQLRILSCWGDANAATPAAHLAALFPHARLQPKGLLATEGFISLPLGGYKDAALAIRSHFLEFLPVNSGGEVDTAHPLLAHQLERGHEYAVVLTTGGGLYRYRLNDAVEVTGRFHDCPLVRFTGRLGHVADWFGEKLNEAHVARALRDVMATRDISPQFAMLACDTAPPCASYVLYIEAEAQEESLTRAATQIDSALRRNFHYDYARKLSQLGAMRVFRARQAAESYMARTLGNGQRAGDIKPLALDRRDGWSTIFRGQFVHPPTP